MHLAPSALLAVAFLLSPALAEVREIPGSAFEAGNWIGGAYTDAAGRFAYCYATVSYLDGQTLWLGLFPDDTLSILMSRPGVTFKPGQTFELWVMMETGLPAIGSGEAWDDSHAGITYTGIAATVAFLNSGRYLRILGMGIDDGFDVDGIGPALAQAQDCLARHGGAGGKVPDPHPRMTGLPGLPDPGGPRTSGIGAQPSGALGAPAPKPQP
ncbi:hypothetical protein [Rhodobacter calidifons]|uniref:Invasion protein IalB n=1 Tax=Rhodobacter calidifons TaxID=2715277 RepID=A0ABX0G9D3_9RHOB|nr:hypothetical protein [Rhodobacter calidifons]NHB77859.1 hypothetical protein [Rhodobacter calidifons]